MKLFATTTKYHHTKWKCRSTFMLVSINICLKNNVPKWKTFNVQDRVTVLVRKKSEINKTGRVYSLEYTKISTVSLCHITGNDVSRATKGINNKCNNGIKKKVKVSRYTPWRRMGVSGQRHAPAALYPRGKDPRYPFDRRLSGPHSRSGCRG
jgi:hypothetical protein